MRLPVERCSDVLSGASRCVAVTALFVVAGLFSPACYADDITYGYDALNRLTSVAVAGDAAYYDYDAAGNITAIRRQAVVSSAVNNRDGDAVSSLNAQTQPAPVSAAQTRTR